MLKLPTDLPRRYRYRMTSDFRFGTWHHSYELVGRHGGMHLSISGPHVYDGRENWSAGLETHWRTPPDYMEDQPPSHDKCWLLKCPCWHDGTSLYAQEHYLPLFMAGRHESILQQMAMDADSRWGRVEP